MISCNNQAVEIILDDTSLLQRVVAAGVNDIKINIYCQNISYLTDGTSIGLVLSAANPPYYAPVIIKTPVLISENSSHLTMIMSFLQVTSHNYVNRSIGSDYFSKIMRMARIIGLMAIISYMTVILLTWIYANLSGYVYFSAGEPVLLIKYLEWALGILGIFIAADFLQKELIKNPKP